MRILSQIWILVPILCISLHANILNIPSEYGTIQEGINATNTGDTVLVHPGTYIENISFNGKNIHVGSLYLTTSDTSYISQTIIDGNQNNSVVRFENMENSTAKLSGFTITNGSNILGGGGIFCFAFSSPTLEHLIIKENNGSGGGGVLCFGYANPILNNLIIKNNEAVLYGGGIHCEFLSSPTLNNVMISNNISYQDGGGMYFLDSCNATLNNTIIKNNFAERYGGGIGSENGSNINTYDIQVFQNSAQLGGGIYLKNTNTNIDQSKIYDNRANKGGGIYLYSCNQPHFSNSIIEKNRSYISGGGFSIALSNINLENVTIRNNVAHNQGGGIFCDSSNINFNSINRRNIYLNFAGRTGNDLINSGPDAINVLLDTFTVKNYPAKYQVHPTSQFIFDILYGKVQSTSANLYVAQSGSDENDGLTKHFPLKTLALALTKALPDSLNSQTIFVSGGIYSTSTSGEYFPLNMIEYITIEGDSDSTVVFDAENQSSVFMFDQDNSVSLKNLMLTGGSSDKGGAVYCADSNPFLERITLFGNFADLGGGIYCENNSTPFILNSTLAGNYTTKGGGLYCNNDHISLVNSILWDNYPQEIYFDNLADSGKITIAYSNIKGGKYNIISNPTNYIYWLDGNIDLDPLFIDTSLYNYALQDTSICINWGVNDCLISYDNGTKTLCIPAVNFSGTAPDLGAWEYAEIINNRPFSDPNNPLKFALFQNYPNPFNPRTRIDFQIPEPGNVIIRIYNSIGQLVETLVEGKVSVGKNSVYFDGSNYASDQYFYQISSGKYNSIKKMVLIK